MKEIRKLYKKDIPMFMEDFSFWNSSFLSISRHRLWAHYRNPLCSNDDIVMLLAYIDDKLIGYMGVYTDFVKIENQLHKIGWLSTWWVHSEAKGTGVGRMLLDTMYSVQNGQIGISQFTPSAKRVYDKSGYFTDLKNSKGIKAVLRSNLSFIMPKILPKTQFLKPIFSCADAVINLMINSSLIFCKRVIQKRLTNVSLEYLPFPDAEVRALIDKYSHNDISNKSNSFFEWLKTYNWVYEAPLMKMTNVNRYEFSMYDESFEYYFIKINKDSSCVGFLVLQKRAHTLKVLFTYFDSNTYGQLMSDIIKQHAIKLKICEIICYEPIIVQYLSKSGIFLYKKNKTKQSIISKSFGVNDFSRIRVQFGDGDCCFA